MSTAEKQTTGTHTRAPRRRRHSHTHTAWFLIGGIVLWFYLGIVGLHLLRNPALAPTWLFVGAAVVPATIFWVMVHRLRTTDTVTSVNLVVAAVIGGTLAISLGGTIDALVALVPQPRFGGANGVLSLTLAGFVEEFAKGLLIVIVGWKVVKSTRNGLFVGGAVGLGFAVLETMSYISSHASGADPIYTAGFVAIERGLLAPFCHVLWSSLLGAALFSSAAKTQRFRLSWLVLGTYVGVALLHGTWDGAGPLVGDLTGSTVLSVGVTVLAMILGIVGGGLIWRHVARKHPAPALEAAPTSDASGPAASPERPDLS